LSNEGEIDRYPIHNLTERLEVAVTSGQVFFNVTFVPGEAATMKILVTKMFAGGGFDFLCQPFTSTPETTQHIYSSTHTPSGEVTFDVVGLKPQYRVQNITHFKFYLVFKV